MKKLIIAISLLLSLGSFADVVVLLHGYESNSSVWLNTGIHQTLSQKFTNQHKVYSIPLPSTAPLVYQAKVLSSQLQLIKAKHDEPIIMVGHSTGGVVARLLLTSENNLDIKGLISISSPHLGSNMAFISNIISGAMPFLGELPMFDTLSESKVLYGNIRRRSPLLRQLNVLSHANVCYVSIIRSKSFMSDMISTQHSQNMNNVPALRGRSFVIPSHSSHGLRPYDSVSIANAISMCS
jgi:pimeloyl-ACP methyl ester carboxylesterase